MTAIYGGLICASCVIAFMQVRVSHFQFWRKLIISNQVRKRSGHSEDRLVLSVFKFPSYCPFTPLMISKDKEGKLTKSIDWTEA